MAKKIATCPVCKCTMDITKERRDSFNCHHCNTVLVRKVQLLKGELKEIDGRHIT